MSVQGGITIVASVEETLDVPENHLGSIFNYINRQYQFVDGVAAAQNDLVWSDRRTVAGGVTDTIDLNGGGLLDVYGNAVAFIEVTAIVIFNRETAVGTRTLNFGPAVVNPFLWLLANASDLIVIPPSGVYVQWDDNGRTVVPGASDAIRLVNTDGANAVIYDIIIVGRTA